MAAGILIRGTLYSLVFLLCVLIFARVRSRKVRQAILLIGSYTLYLSWGSWFAAVLLASTVMNYLLGEWLRRKTTAAVLSIGIVFNIALLGIFKYLPPIAAAMPGSLQGFAHLALPLGISFWTFQAMSYLFDLYRGEELDPSFFEFASYMAFFPVAISGPICRMPEMLPQFRSEAPTSWNNIAHGVRRIALGVFMVQLARLLGQGILAGDGINRGFDQAVRWSGPDIWCLAFGYGLQLFFDFAGYSHVAIGAARALGLTVPENFARPFAATSSSAFWTRWHTSLSFWIRDYVFLPLAMFRREMWWRNLVLVVSMVLFGLWHKATLLFILWGCYHGVLLVLHRQIQALQRRFEWDPPALIWTPLSWIMTSSLISLGWILFRANSIGEARTMFGALISASSYATHFLSGSLYLLVAVLALGYALTQWLAEVLETHSAEARTGFLPILARWRWYWITPVYAIALLFVLIVTHSRGTDTAQLMYRGF